jgi:hypothetical protein
VSERFVIEKPEFDTATGVASFRYGIADRVFTETLTFPQGGDAAMVETASFRKLLDLTAVVLGVSYFKLRAPFVIESDISLNESDERNLTLDIYENGLGEFYARNDLKRFGQISINVNTDNRPAPSRPRACPTAPCCPSAAARIRW